MNFRRFPHGERGLKYHRDTGIEDETRRFPHGERGLKFYAGYKDEEAQGRFPHGERGLKFFPIASFLYPTYFSSPYTPARRWDNWSIPARPSSCSK